MTQIVQDGSVNLLALGSPKAVVQIQQPRRPIVGVQTNILSFIGVASWGPVNVPTVVGGNDEQQAVFGPISNRKFDLSTAVAVAVDQFCSSFKNVRVTDGTDLAASGVFASSETFETVTVGGSISNGDSATLTVTPNGGIPVVLTIPIVTGDTTTTVAAKIAASVDANVYLVLVGGLIANSVGAVCTIAFPAGGTFSRTNGSGITFTLGTTTASVTKFTAVAAYTGSEGNKIQLTIAGGSAIGTIKLIVARPNYAAEVFDNIGGIGYLMWANMANAVNNGNSSIRGPSKLITMTAGITAGLPPGVATVVTIANGTDGAIITDSALLGSDSVPRRGIYTLRNQGVSVVCPVDASISTYWPNYATFGLGEGVLVEVSTPAGDSLTNAATELSSAGVDSYGLKVDFGDWIYWWDDVNQTQRLLSPATFLSGRRANLAPQESVLNKPCNNIIGSQKTLTGGVWSDADKDALYNYRMDLLCNPVPGGSYWGSNNGINTSSNAAVNGDNYTLLTNFIAKSVAGWAGVNVGKLQTPDQRKDAKAAADDFFDGMWELGMIGNVDSAFGIGDPPWSVAIDDTTTPLQLAALGYEIAAVRVQYLAVIRWFIINLMGGQTVQVRVSATPPSFLIR